MLTASLVTFGANLLRAEPQAARAYTGGAAPTSMAAVVLQDPAVASYVPTTQTGSAGTTWLALLMSGGTTRGRSAAALVSRPGSESLRRLERTIAIVGFYADP